MLDEGVSHFLGEDAIPHAAQVVVDQFREALAFAVEVETGVSFGNPQLVDETGTHLFGLACAIAFLTVGQFLRDFGQGGAGVVAVGHDVHGGEGNHDLVKGRGWRPIAGADDPSSCGNGRGFVDPAAPRCRAALRKASDPGPGGVVRRVLLSSPVSHTHQVSSSAVAVGIAGAPQIGVERRKRVVELFQIDPVPLPSSDTCARPARENRSLGTSRSRRQVQLRHPDIAFGRRCCPGRACGRFRQRSPCPAVGRRRAGRA